MQIAELMAMSNAVQMPPTPTTAIAAAADLRPYYLKDLDLESGKRTESIAQKGLLPPNKTPSSKSKKHK